MYGDGIHLIVIHNQGVVIRLQIVYPNDTPPRYLCSHRMTTNEKSSSQTQLC